MKKFKENCPFCKYIERKEYLSRNLRAAVLRDRYPVTPGHTLIIPLRHIEDVFGMSFPERTSAWRLILRERKRILTSDPSVSGFNIGVNSGVSAGQTVSHCHIHLIPRRRGDTPDPSGGIRSVIPGKRAYGDREGE